MKRWHLVAAAAAVPLFALACGGDDNGSNEAPDDAISLSASGAELSDEEYLRVFCSGISKYRVALNTASREELTDVVEEYRDSMAEVNPPADAKTFHDAFVDYLTEALDEPTALITRDPPVPEDEVRDRLAGKQSSVDECEYPTFLGGETS